MPAIKKKWVCYECGTITDDDKILTATSPFDSDSIIVCCPFCKAVNSLYVACDEYGCKKIANYGFQTAEGYVNTCGEHMRKHRKPQ